MFVKFLFKCPVSYVYIIIYILCQNKNIYKKEVLRITWILINLSLSLNTLTCFMNQLSYIILLTF